MAELSGAPWLAGDIMWLGWEQSPGTAPSARAGARCSAAAPISQAPLALEGSTPPGFFYIPRGAEAELSSEQILPLMLLPTRLLFLSLPFLQRQLIHR